MPLPMVHLGVAKRLSEKMNVGDLSAFYLGCIAPDGIYTREGFVKEQKKKNHLKPTGCVRTVDDIISFFKAHRDLHNTSFVLGYAVHVLTDHIYNESVYRVYLERYDADPAPVLDKTWAYYNDSDIVDFELFAREPWRADVWHYLEDSCGVTIDEFITAGEANSWRDRTLHWYDGGESDHKYPVKYITYEDEVSFIDSASEQIYNLLNPIL